MQQHNDRDGLLAAVRSVRDEIERIVAEVDEERVTQPGSAEGWSFKDTIAHLTGWRWRTVARLEAGLQGQAPTMPWPAPLDEEDDLDEINRWFFSANRNKPFTEVLGESRETFERVERAIVALPEEDLFTADRFPWLAGYRLGPAVVEGTVDHFREHEPELRALRSRG